MITIIAAISRDFCIGRNGEIPWNLPEDLKRFRKLTSGNTIIMGRKTWDSLPMKPLPGRQNIIISSKMKLNAPSQDILIVNSLEEAIKSAKNTEIFLIGGESIYTKGLQFSNRMLITHVDIDISETPGGVGDAFFPRWDEKEWKLKTAENHDGHHFNEYERR